MSASDDYPWVHSTEDIVKRSIQHETMCSEIDRLRAEVAELRRPLPSPPTGDRVAGVPPWQGGRHLEVTDL